MGNQSQEHQGIQAADQYPSTSSFNDADLCLDFRDTDWMWDIGFPSLLPTDIESYSTT
jgi:hypothetical protein